MILSKKAIIDEYKKGNIIHYSKYNIEDYTKNQSIDIHIGDYIYLNDNWVDITEGYLVPPNSFFLAYTEEFIGTAPNSNIHPQFHQRSTLAREGLFHTKAGWGDVGFHNRWAMEFYTLKPFFIKAGDRVGQISFGYTTESENYATETGNYQAENELMELVKNWKKEDILPKNNR